MLGTAGGRYANRIIGNERVVDSTEQGQLGRDVFLLLDGMVSVEVDGSVLGEVGPGAVVGERAVLTDGRRTASLQALTDCVVAVAAHDQIDQAKLAALAEGHRREKQQ